MGSRAENVEALMAAFAEVDDDVGCVQETAEDVAWIGRWWPIMEAAMREEESLLRRPVGTATTQLDVDLPTQGRAETDPGEQELEVTRTQPLLKRRLVRLPMLLAVVAAHSASPRRSNASGRTGRWRLSWAWLRLPNVDVCCFELERGRPEEVQGWWTSAKRSLGSRFDSR